MVSGINEYISAEEMISLHDVNCKEPKEYVTDEDMDFEAVVPKKKNFFHQCIIEF